MRRTIFGCAVACLLSVAVSACGGGNGGSAVPSGSLPAQNSFKGNLVPSATDTTAVANASNLSVHAFSRLSGAPSTVTSKVAKPMALGYQGDLRYFNGAIVDTANFYNIYINSKPSDFGATFTPDQFLAYLFNSDIIRETNLYAYDSAPNRYHSAGYYYGQEALYSPAKGQNPTISQSSILGFVHQAVVQSGQAGYTTVYNVFLPNGTDTCFDLTSACYSPDNLSSFVFCGYHGSVDFTDISKHVLFTVEPYDNVLGCSVNTTQLVPPNGVANDSQDSVLLHETFETITDPDPGKGWNNSQYGEIADLCNGFNSVFNIGGANFETQLVYSNYDHACTNAYP